MIGLSESKFAKISVEILCLVILAAALIPTNFYIDPHNRGFFCNDQSIMYPRVEKETISNLTLGIIALIFFIFDYYRGNFSRPKNAVISAITHLQSAKLDYINLPQGRDLLDRGNNHSADRRCY
ncbi:GSCOCG00005049001-RA-CDS [Cotesia congregata]|nr:GSCOCG00005049001-RA-CDS [Cotesia congregata]